MELMAEALLEFRLYLRPYRGHRATREHAQLSCLRTMRERHRSADQHNGKFVHQFPLFGAVAKRIGAVIARSPETSVVAPSDAGVLAVDATTDSTATPLIGHSRLRKLACPWERATTPGAYPGSFRVARAHWPSPAIRGAPP